VALGCTWGVFIAHGFRVNRVLAMPSPFRAGNVSILDENATPPKP